MESERKVVNIVGCGPGGAAYLTGQARQAVNEAGIVIGIPKFLRLFPEVKRKIELAAVHTDKVAELVAGLDVSHAAVLVSGDTGLYSLASFLRKALPGCWEVRFVPGISSVQAACALFCLEWHDMRIFSLHSRPAPPELAETVWRGKHPVAILCGPANRPQSIARKLLSGVEPGPDTCRGSVRRRRSKPLSGIEPGRRCYAACDLGSENQIAWSGSLCELAEKRFGGRSVLIIDRR